MIELDDKDRALIRALAKDATQSAGALGRELGLSQPACWRRIKRLRVRMPGAPGTMTGRKQSAEAASAASNE